MKQLTFLTYIVAALIIVANARNIARQEQTNFTIATDVAYTDSYGNANKLDIYYDQNNLTEGVPVIIYIHGGYWCEGDKENDSQIGLRIQEEGYVAVIPNYRLYPQANTIDDMVEDIYNIVQWTVQNIETYGGDYNNMTLIGFNAGAHLASLTLLKSVLHMEVNNNPLGSLVRFKHLILLNSQFTFEKNERLEFEITNMRNTAALSPTLEYLNNYADAKEHLFLGKTGYDEVDILKTQNDKSIFSFGADKISFIECDNDTNNPIGSSQSMISEVKRVVYDYEIVKRVFHGNYDYVVEGVKTGDEEITGNFMRLIKSSYEIE